MIKDKNYQQSPEILGEKGRITSYTSFICSGNRKWDPIGVSDEVIEEIKDNFIRNLYWAGSDNILRSFIIL